MHIISDYEKSIRLRLKYDYPHYAAKCLKIRTKSGDVEPFILNDSQLYLHRKIENQKLRTGKVRILLGKARQTGFSTYIGGRFYWRATHYRGQRVFILTHEQDATDNLFKMVDRFHEHCPEIIKPHTGASNAKELYFDKLDSGYAVGTAGTKAVGRSQTIQLLHGSEVHFWPNAAGHFAGVVQAVPDLPETEIILESTGNGVGGEFHERWQRAEAGDGDYEAIFIPWFMAREYWREPEPGFLPDEEEKEYARLHGLSDGQIYWRRMKIADLKDPMLFKQEYPATADEMFQSTGHDSFIKSELVIAARKNTCEGVGPLVIGGDPARFGDDRFSLAWRQGRKVHKVESQYKLGTVEGANWIKQVIDRDKPARLFLDLGGVGAGTYDILHSWGAPYDEVVVGINFGSPPQEPIEYLPTEGGEVTKVPGPLNRRAEMWKRSRDWLQHPAGVDLPDLDSLQADATGPKYKYNMEQRLQLESKEDMRRRGIRSPDEWDAIALTFAEPVKEPRPVDTTARRERPMQIGGGSGGPSTAWLGN